MALAMQDSERIAESHHESPVDTDRRRRVAGIGTLATASLFPFGTAVQNGVREAEIIIIGGSMADKLAADYIHTGHMPRILAQADPARCVTEAEQKN